MKRIVLLIAIVVLISTAAYSQTITRISPGTIKIRDVGLLETVEDSTDPSFRTSWILWVGDSGVVVSPLPDDTVQLTGNPAAHVWTHYILDSSITFYAVSYFDTLHAVIGGSRGAIYHTKDCARSWQRTNIGTTAAIRALAYNKNGVHIAVGDSGLVYRSTDSGLTWQRNVVAGANTFNTVCFGSQTVAFAAGEDSSIFKSTDAGLSWTRVASLGNIISTLKQLGSEVNWSSIAMNGPDTVLIALEQPELMLFSFDGMKTLDTTWLNPSPTSGPIHKVVYLGLNPPLYRALAFGEDDLFHELNDTNFHHWVVSPEYYVVADADGSLDPAPNRNWCASYDARDTDIVFGGDLTALTQPKNFIGAGLGSLIPSISPFWLPGLDSSAVDSLKASNVTLSWPQTSTLTDWLNVSLRSSGKGCSVVVGALLLTSDNGLEWYNTGLAVLNPINTSLMLNDSVCIAIGHGGTIWRTNEGGSGFKPIASNTTERLHGIAFPTTDKGIIVGDNGTILSSTDTGKTWSAVTNILPYDPPVYLADVAFVNDTIGIAVGDSAKILRTTDGGQSWNDIPNFLTASGDFIRQIQAFQDGNIFIRAGTTLSRSTDFGLNWSQVQGVDDSLGMSFYNTQIGICADSAKSSAIVSDTAFFSYTLDGCATLKSFSVPMINYNRVIFHWINNHQVVLYGTWCAEYLVDIGTSGVSVTHIDNPSPLQIFPNPSTGGVSVDYTTKTSGPVTIELWDESGKRIKQLFSGEEAGGQHTRTFTLATTLHGAFFIRLSADGISSAAKLNIQ